MSGFLQPFIYSRNLKLRGTVSAKRITGITGNTHPYVVGINVGTQQVVAALRLQDHSGMRV